MSRQLEEKIEKSLDVINEILYIINNELIKSSFFVDFEGDIPKLSIKSNILVIQRWQGLYSVTGSFT